MEQLWVESAMPAEAADRERLVAFDFGLNLLARVCRSFSDVQDLCTRYTLGQINTHRFLYEIGIRIKDFAKGLDDDSREVKIFYGITYMRNRNAKRGGES